MRRLRDLSGMRIPHMRSSVKLVVDTIEYAMNHVPKWNSISISGYHIRESGSTATQELAFTLRDGMEYVEAAIARGLDVFALMPSEFLTENEIAAAALANQGEMFNPQQQFQVTWPEHPVVGLAYVDQLVRDEVLSADAAQSLSEALQQAVAALDAGADDYLTKPFELQELNARVRAQLRRRRYEADARRPADLTLGDLSIDLFSRSVRRGDREVSLSQREFELLCFLVHVVESWSLYNMVSQKKVRK